MVDEIGLNIEQMKTQVRRQLHIGDLVTIPEDLIGIPDGKKAFVRKIGENYVEFELMTGRKTSFSYFDCLAIKVDYSSGFEINSSETIQNDLTKTRRERKKKK